MYNSLTFDRFLFILLCAVLGIDQKCTILSAKHQGSMHRFCAGLFVALTAPVAAPMRVTK